MDAVDKADAAKFNQSEILDPHGWILLSFLMDPRTGLGRFRDFRISNYDLMMELVDLCLDHSARRSSRPRRRRARCALPRAPRRARGSRSSAAPRPRLGRRARPRDEEIIHRPTASWSTRSIPSAPSRFTSSGAAPAEHGVRGRPLHHRPLVGLRHRPADARYGGGGHEAAGTCQIEQRPRRGGPRRDRETIDAHERRAVSV